MFFFVDGVFGQAVIKITLEASRFLKQTKKSKKSIALCSVKSYNGL